MTRSAMEIESLDTTYAQKVINKRLTRSAIDLTQRDCDRSVPTPNLKLLLPISVSRPITKSQKRRERA
jgi:hypothetical protein